MGPVEFKIVLLGSSHVGKTCLMERIGHDRFRENIPYQNTLGAAFAAKHFMSNRKKILVGIWDTAGSERYESMSRIYYRGAKAAIICYSVCDLSLIHICQWLADPVILAMQRFIFSWSTLETFLSSQRIR